MKILKVSQLPLKQSSFWMKNKKLISDKKKNLAIKIVIRRFDMQNPTILLKMITEITIFVALSPRSLGHFNKI